MRDLLDNVQVSILPAANPDGFTRFELLRQNLSTSRGFTRAHKGSCSGTRRREGERNAAEVEENYLWSQVEKFQVSIEGDFPVSEDWTRFQTDLDFDPYLERQPETQVGIEQLITQHHAHRPFCKLASVS